MKFITISFRILTSLVLTTVLGTSCFAQQGDNNIYSRFGIGNLEQQGNPIQMGMGSTGVANNRIQSVNFLNPASFSYLPMTCFQASGALRQSTYTFDASSTKIFTGYLKEVALGFRKPGSPYGFGLGMQPFSFVNYKASAQTDVGDSLRTTYTYQGKGGLNKATLAMSRKFVLNNDSLNSGKKHVLSIGINLNYVFGTIDHSSKTSFDDFSNYESSRYAQNHFLSGFQPDLGLLYSMPLSHTKDVNQKVNQHQELVLGLNWGLASHLKSKSIYSEELLYGGSTLETSLDTTLYDPGVRFKFQVPQQIRAGLTWNFYQVKFGDLQITAEIMQQDWSQSQFNLARDVNPTNQLSAAQRVSFGLAYTPDNSEKTGTLRHCTYRIGYFQGEQYYRINDLAVKETGITAGLSVPILKSLNKINLAAAYLTNGTNNNSLLQSKGIYYQVGFTFIPREPWFFQRKYD
jgi:hypothetical protein